MITLRPGRSGAFLCTGAITTACNSYATLGRNMLYDLNTRRQRQPQPVRP